MREILQDILKQTSSLYECLVVTVEDDKTKLEATDKEATVFLQAELKNSIPEFIGQFGMNNLTMLAGLLSFPSYNTDTATFTVGRGQHRGQDIVTQIVFKDGKGGFSDYRLVMPSMLPEQAEIRSIPWNITFEPNRSRLAEFQQLSSLYSKAGGAQFAPKTIDGDLHFFIGEEDSADHSASMLFEPSVDTILKGEIKFPTQVFLSVIKIAGTNPVTISIASVGALKISIETPHGTYNYIIRGSR